MFTAISDLLRARRTVSERIDLLLVAAIRAVIRALILGQLIYFFALTLLHSDPF